MMREGQEVMCLGENQRQQVLQETGIYTVASSWGEALSIAQDLAENRLSERNKCRVLSTEVSWQKSVLSGAVRLRREHEIF